MPFTTTKFEPKKRGGGPLPAPANFKTFNEFAGYTARDGWLVLPVIGSSRPIYEAAKIEVTDRGFASASFIYIQGVWLDDAYWFWNLVYGARYRPPSINMGAAMTLAEATEKGYLWGMHLLIGDVFATGYQWWNGP